MPETANFNLTYPDSAGHTRLWEHIQALAEDVDGLKPTLIPDWQAYTPTWTGSGGNPAIGNGTITARYRQIGKLVHVNVRILMGSTTTYGSGGWTVSLPVAGAQVAVGSAYLRDASATSSGHFPGICVLDPALNANGVNFFNVNAQIQPTIPFTWANTDHLSLSIAYEAA